MSLQINVSAVQQVSCQTNQSEELCYYHFCRASSLFSLRRPHLVSHIYPSSVSLPALCVVFPTSALLLHYPLYPLLFGSQSTLANAGGGGLLLVTFKHFGKGSVQIRGNCHDFDALNYLTRDPDKHYSMREEVRKRKAVPVKVRRIE